jgi:hypothetical protein
MYRIGVWIYSSCAGSRAGRYDGCHDVHHRVHDGGTDHVDD